jgi:hypothetical protein
MLSIEIINSIRIKALSDEHDAEHGARSGMDQATARSRGRKPWPSSWPLRTERSRPVM